MKTRLLTQASLLIALTFVFLSSCDQKADEPVLVKIALSKGIPANSYANYYNWVHSLDSTSTCTDLYGLDLDSALELFRQCNGLVLTGGTDVNPGLYGKPEDTVRCWPINHRLDQLELTLIDSALAWGMPILGICRGHQMLNVALGGSLIVDIPTDFDTTVSHKCEDFSTCFHQVSIDPNSLLYSIVNQVTGEVNSSHHQGADLMAPALKAVAFTSDGLVEAEEWKNPEGKSFLIGVQWHPERLDAANPMTTAIGNRFLEECRKYGNK